MRHQRISQEESFVCRCSTTSHGTLKSERSGKLSIHYCANLETIETVFRTIISVNQLSIYGAVAQMCEMNPFMIEGGNPLWEDNRVPHSYQA